MALSDFLNVTITVSAAKATGPGFGIPLILSNTGNALFAGVRSYANSAGVLADFAITTPEYQAANAMFSQAVPPPLVKIGVGTHVPTQQYQFTPIVVNSTVYTINIVDTAGVTHTATYTSTNAATAALIINGLKAAIDALSLALTTSNVGPNTLLQAVANVAGTYWGMSVPSTQTSTLLGIAETEADAGVATDLAALNLVDPNWYALQLLFKSKAIIVAADGWVESNTKLMVAASVDSAIPNTAVGGADVASTLNSAAEMRSGIVYHALPSEWADACEYGEFLPMVSGSEVWAFKTLIGVTPDTLTETQRTNVLAKKANVVEQVAGVNIENQGTVASGEWIDVVRFRDWLSSTIAINIFNLLVAAQNKVSYDDPGFAKVAAALRAAIKSGQDAGGIPAGPEGQVDANGNLTTYTVTVPLASSETPTNRTNRNLAGLSFQAILAGAVVAVNPLQGVLIG